ADFLGWHVGPGGVAIDQGAVHGSLLRLMLHRWYGGNNPKASLHPTANPAKIILNIPSLWRFTMSGPYQPIDRRDLFALSTAAGVTLLAQSRMAAAEEPKRKRYAMKKSINQWAFPYPDKMNLEQCLRLAKAAGFDGIELNYDLENDLSPKSGPKEYSEIRKLA